MQLTEITEVAEITKTSEKAQTIVDSTDKHKIVEITNIT